MKKIVFAIAGASALALTACNPANEAEDQAEAVGDAETAELEAQADQAEAMGNEVAEQQLEVAAEASEDQTEVESEAVDPAQ